MENNWKILRNLFLSRSSLEKIFEFLDDSIKDDYIDENQILIYRSTCGDELASIYPPARSYCSKFLKDLIKKIEDSRNVVNETIYQHYIELLNDKHLNDEFHYLTYTVCNEQFTFKQSDKIVTDGTTGLKSWRAGLQLFEQIYANRERAFKNKGILEIGSGCGLTGILISALCEEIKSYTFSDHHERVLSLIKDNLEINGFSLNKNSNKKSDNVFYKYKDEDGNMMAKYYDEDEQEDEFKSSSFSGFGSFMRQGSMELVPKRRNEFSLSDDRRLETFGSIKKESIFDYSDSFNGLDKYESKIEEDPFKTDKFKEKSKEFDKKLENFNEQVVNFEELLKNFEEKLSLLDENVNNTNNQNKPRILNSKFKDRSVDVLKLDWFDSNSEIADKLTKSNPDYLIGSDIIYDPSIVKDLCRLFKLCLNTLESCSIIVVNCIRNETTIKTFEHELRKLQKDEENIKIQRTKLSSKLTYFDNLETDENSKFVLYNICKDE